MYEYSKYIDMSLWDNIQIVLLQRTYKQLLSINPTIRLFSERQ